MANSNEQGPASSGSRHFDDIHADRRRETRRHDAVEEARADAEIVRERAETERNDNEWARRAAERGRVSEEDIRLIAEDARKAAEEARLLAEATRAEARQACEDTARQLEELKTVVLRLSEASKKS